MEKYIAVNENANGYTDIKIRVYYDLGGYNLATYTPKKRGYYVSVIPVERTRKNGYTMERTDAFSGTIYFITEVKRQSKKAEADAHEKARQVEKTLIQWICDKNSLTIKE
jgi:hypothetical protein